MQNTEKLKLGCPTRPGLYHQIYQCTCTYPVRKKYLLLLIGDRQQSSKFMHVLDVVASSGHHRGWVKAPTYIQECEQSFVNWLTAINRLNTLVSFFHSPACCHLIRTSQNFSCTHVPWAGPSTLKESNRSWISKWMYLPLHNYLVMIFLPKAPLSIWAGFHVHHNF